MKAQEVNKETTKYTNSTIEHDNFPLEKPHIFLFVTKIAYDVHG